MLCFFSPHVRRVGGWTSLETWTKLYRVCTIWWRLRHDRNLNYFLCVNSSDVDKTPLTVPLPFCTTLLTRTAVWAPESPEETTRCPRDSRRSRWVARSCAGHSRSAYGFLLHTRWSFPSPASSAQHFPSSVLDLTRVKLAPNSADKSANVHNTQHWHINT